MYLGLGLGLLGYALYSTSDAAVKAIGHGLSSYQVCFTMAFLSLPLLAFTLPRGARLSDIIRTGRPGLMLTRAATSTLGSIFSILAFQSLPFAEAYSILFLMPSFSTLWSVLFLKERVSVLRWCGVALGLVGVILVVRPSFDTLQWAHAAALGGALCGSVTLVLLRELNRTEKSAALLFYALAAAVLVNGTLMLPTAEVPTLFESGFLLLAAAGSGAAQLAQIAAARRIPASRIVPAQYSQIIWALIIGGLFFNEYPDAVALIGIALVVTSGLVNFIPGPKPTAQLRPGRHLTPAGAAAQRS